MNEATRQVYNLHDVLNERLPHFQLLTIRDCPGPRPRESRRWDNFMNRLVWRRPCFVS